MLLILKRILIAAVASFCILCGGDYLLAKYRMQNPKAGDALGTIKTQPTYAIPHKDGKSEFVFGDPVAVTCLHSLFPHFGYSPCWYVNRQSSKPIPMVLLPMPPSAI
jgi:hypothetical protein